MPKIALDSKTDVVIRLAGLADAEQIHKAICAMSAGLGAADSVQRFQHCG
jgi:hypothetical protein